MVSGGKSHDTPVFIRESLRPGDRIPGPAIIAERNATTVVEPEWEATVTVADHLVLERVAERKSAHALGTTVDPVMLEDFNNLFMSIAEQMGVRLAHTAYSVNSRAPRLLLRALRADGTSSPRAPLRAPGLDGREPQP